MSWGGILAAGAAAWVGSAFLTPLIRKLAISLGCVAKPSQDRWGHRAIARLGGIPIAVAFLIIVGLGVRQEARLMGLLLGGGLMFVVGLVDDFKRLRPYSKLVSQIIAGCLVTLVGIQFDTRIAWLVVPGTIAWLVLVMNAFNLIDNMDGLSAGIGVIAASFFAWHAAQTGQGFIAIICATLAGSTLGFLRYNLPPAKIFMGDSGSQVLGLGLGTMALMGTWHQPVRLLGILALPAFLLAVPLFDTCFVTIQRILHGRHPFQGGTDHLSHRLGLLGLTTRRVVFTLYGFSAAFGVLTLVLSSQSAIAITGVLLLAGGLFLLLGNYLAHVPVYTDRISPSAEFKITWIDTTLLNKRYLLEVSVDFVGVCASYIFAHALRFESNITPDLEGLILKSLPLIISVKMLSFFMCGLYRGVWKYTSLIDLVNIARAVALGSIFSALALLYVWRFEGYSRAVFIIDGLLLFLTMSGARVTERLLNEWIRSSVQGAIPVLIIGAGDTGELLLRQLKQDAGKRRRVVGFIDDEAAKQGNRIHGVPVVGFRKDLGRVVNRFQVQEVLIAIRRPPMDLVQQTQGYCEENGIAWQLFSDLLYQKSPTPSDT